MATQRMPFGKQFSPNQVDLVALLRLADLHRGDRRSLEAAIAEQILDSREEKMAMNTFLALREYGLLTGDRRSYDLTEVGEHLLSLADDRQQLVEAFARHILTALHGVQLVEVCSARRARGEPCDAQALAADLANLEIDAGGRGGEKLNPIRLWLQEAGVFSARDRWRVSQAGLERVLGVSANELEQLVDLSEQQRSYLLALASITGRPPFDSQKVVALARQQVPDVRFDPKQVPKQVLAPLEARGWLTVTKVTSGRGAKPHQVTPTAAFVEKVSEPLLEALVRQTHLVDPVVLRRPFAELLGTARSREASTFDKGNALEGICLQFVRLMGARFLKWRHRAKETSRAEVDLLAELRNGRYQLLQVQSKVSPITTRSIVDRELGVATTLRSDIIIFISAGKIGPAPRRAAVQYIRDTGKALLFLDGADLDGVAADPAHVTRAVQREFHVVRDIRRSRLTDPR